MKRLVFVLLLLFTFFASPAYAAKPTPTPTPPPSSVKKICVDPGHGGNDTGAVYQTLAEREVNLDIAQRLQALLQGAGYTVVMTRTDNTTTLSNTDRANICNAANVDYVLAIHLNASTDHTIDYTQGFYGKQIKDKPWTQKINTAMAQLSNASGTGTITNNGITQFADGVLLKTNVPATLAETVFLSSDAEYALLSDGTGNRQQAIAQSLFNGVTSQ